MSEGLTRWSEFPERLCARLLVGLEGATGEVLLERGLTDLWVGVLCLLDVVGSRTETFAR